MILFDFISKNNFGDIDIILDVAGDDNNPIYHNSSGLLQTSRRYRYLLCYPVKSFNIYECDNILKHMDDDTYCNICIDMSLGRPTILSKMTFLYRYLKTMVSKALSRKNIRVTCRRLFIDKYYIQQFSDEYCEISNLPASLSRSVKFPNEPGAIDMYNADIVEKFGRYRYRQPIFRVHVYKSMDMSLDNEFINDDYIDPTMVFTLDRNPKPIQPYDVVSRRLKGNIIPEGRVNELVEFVKNNYDVFIEAWHTHPSEFGSPKLGIELSRIKRLIDE